MSFVVLANFKSHMTSAEVTSWLHEVAPDLVGQSNTELILAPSLVHLPVASSLITRDSLPITLCAQDVSPFPSGAYTGAVNATQLSEYGVKYALVGHSERRKYFHETASDIANKVRELISAGITPAICLSRDDIAPQFAALDDSDYDKCIYCFEPPADIGGTVTAPTTLINDTVHMIKKYVNAPVLYGGSVTAENIATLLPLALDGVLVATASLDPLSIRSIINTCLHAR